MKTLTKVRPGQTINKEDAVILAARPDHIHKEWQVVLCYRAVTRELVVWSWSMDGAFAQSGDYFPLCMDAALSKAVARYETR